jgi:hypothetical protein
MIASPVDLRSLLGEARRVQTACLVNVQGGSTFFQASAEFTASIAWFFGLD